MICELDAVVVALYGLDEKHLRDIFDTIHEDWGREKTPRIRCSASTIRD